jgi:hypothetical protein
MISGLLHVQRAPGMLVIQAKSDGHEFNWETMDVSHTVNHLSFGPFLSETDWMVMPHTHTHTHSHTHTLSPSTPSSQKPT